MLHISAQILTFKQACPLTACADRKCKEGFQFENCLWLVIHLSTPILLRTQNSTPVTQGESIFSLMCQFVEPAKLCTIDVGVTETSNSAVGERVILKNWWF